VAYEGRALPAELVILRIELAAHEQGVWMNSRGFMSGVADLVSTPAGSKSPYKTRREPLPGYAAEALKRMYQAAGVRRGCPDLVIWNTRTRKIRLVEVKNPNYDHPTAAQRMILKAAESLGVAAKIVEWEFRVPSNHLIDRTAVH